MLNFLDSLLPLHIIIVSLSAGVISLVIVLLSGLSGDNVSTSAVIGRSLYAFAFVGLVNFIVIMSIEEYALWRTNRELEEIIEKAQLTPSEKR